MFGVGGWGLDGGGFECRLGDLDCILWAIGGYGMCRNYFLVKK